jgi:hypothetical protein
MKYIKKYEIVTPEYGEIRYVWITYKDDVEKFRIALLKIGINKDDIKAWIKSDIMNNDNDEIYIYKIIDYDPYITREYFDYSFDYVEKEGDKYMGEIIISDEEVDANKYNL